MMGEVREAGGLWAVGQRGPLAADREAVGLVSHRGPFREKRSQLTWFCGAALNKKSR
jgi:hypothetical protein